MSSRKKCRGAWLGQEESCEEEDEDLLVFGYSCKVFRDDEKALYVEEGRHLIPWMGDPSLLIDRYDGRGYLHDLKQFETTTEGDSGMVLSEEESHLEQLCDEERYLALNKSLIEEELYHEEELKRLRAALADEGAYNQVGFSYAESQGASHEEIEEKKEHIKDENEDFVPLAELNVPTGMEVPSSSKMNAIIEKTALFVSAHGPQMEIVIKAKQANNTQFAFLAFDHSLNPYYKHMVQAIKLGKYVPQPVHPAGEDDDDETDEDGDDHYLHPSLQPSRLNTSQVLTVPKLSYAKTGDDRYSLLVSQLKDKVLSGIQVAQEAQTARNGTAFITESPLPPPPGLVPVTLPSNGGGEISNNLVNHESGSPFFPPPELRPIIDKMASYVAKNGEGFEMVVKSKGADSRFDFLKPGHQFYPYYQHKIKMFTQELSLNDKNADNSAGMTNLLDKDSKTGLVSFSIKMKEMSEKRNALVSAGSDGDEGRIESPTRKKMTEKMEGQSEDVEEINKVKIQAQEARQAEERIKDKLAAAARERLVQVSREKQLQMERKRKAALFLSLLQKGKEDDCNLIGPKLPTADELEVLVNGEGDLPLVPPASTISVTSMVVASQSLSATVITPSVTMSSTTVTSISQGRDLPKVASSPLTSHYQSETRSRSRSLIKHKRRQRSRSHSKERKSHKKKRRRRRSRSQSASSHEQSPSRSIKFRDHRKCKSSKMPSSAYYSSRTSVSPRHEFYRAPSNPRNYEKRHSHSRSRFPADERGRRTPSPHSGKRQFRSNFRSQTPSRSRSRSRSRRSHSSQSRSTSPYRSRGVIKR